MPEHTGLGALPWLLWPVLVAALLGAVALALSSYGARRWAKAMRALRRALDAGRVEQRPQSAATPATPTRYHLRELDGLPAPVQRITTRRPGFVWDARSGLIDSFRAEARGAMVGGELVMAPWEGRWSNYQRHQGMQLPHTGEVAWMRPEGRRPYFIGTVTALRLDFAR